ncbi:MAG: DUF4430 domain-containing protein [Lachnospiraceae bacterium]|nr:DUF4430 domain-containing protein [Lachnospiraceae bacterium]
MKKTIRSFLGMALSVMLILSMTVSSFADEAVFFEEFSAFSMEEADVSGTDEVTEVLEVAETDLSEEREMEEGDSSSMLGTVTVVAVSDVYNDMKTRFTAAGCANGSTTDITSFWNMLAMKALGIPGNTGTKFEDVNYSGLTSQVLAKFIIAMVNDGKDPTLYGEKNSEGTVTKNVIELLKSKYNSETGAYGGSVYEQPFAMYALSIVGEEAGEKAGTYYAEKQNADGIISDSWGIDMDTTAWAITGCHVAGVTYPNEDEALSYMAEHTADMNANTLGCYLDCLSYLGQLTEEKLSGMVNDPAMYSASEKSFLYGGTANDFATVQATVPLGEFYNEPVYKAYKNDYTPAPGRSSKKVCVRIADAKSETVTEDILKRTKLTVESGASLVLSGITTASADVTLLDVFTEAVCAEKLGKDPTLSDLEANKTYINDKLAAADTGYGLSLTKLYGYEDYNFGYYVNRETMAWSPLDPVTADDTEVFLFHYDYTVASYAVFDKATYTATTSAPATVTVKKAGYDDSWNTVFTGIPATVQAKNGSNVKTFTCAEDGTVKLSGLAAGTYDLTATFGTADAYIVSPYAVLTVSAAASKTVYARIADAKSETVTEDILKRTKLTVESGASLVLSGITTASADVTLLDVFTEAVCAEKLGKDPTLSDLEANKTYINDKLAAADTGYGLSLTKLYGYEDYNFGYYVNRETMAWSPLDPVTADDTEVFLFHYDYTVASYAVFDKATYTATTSAPATVTVKKAGYDDSWNTVFTGIPATVQAKNGSNVKTFTCAEDGTVKLSGLAAGTYDLTATFGTADAYIVSPYAVLTVTKSGSESGGGSSSGGSSSGTTVAKPSNTGSVGAPVTDGTWTQLTDGRWMFKTNALFRSTWGYIRNPYAPLGAQDAWFYFDRNGCMLTGWQRIIDNDGMYRWYYLNPVSDGSLGACFLNGVTPDGYTVNENGAWTVDGVVQEEKASAEAISAKTVDYGSSREETEVKGSFSISLSASVTTTEGKKVSFSGSKKFSLADYEGSTAFDLLSELCDEKGWDIEGSGSYVSAVNGLAEFDAGSQSGWMYSVNGKYPDVPAGDYVVQKGDKIAWKYVTSWVNTGM